MKNKDFLATRGKVIRLLRNNTFNIECNNGKIVTANIAARFRTAAGKRRAKIVVGDKVIVEISLRDLEKGQIVSFFDEREKSK
jgi:translation initiation factor IF-1